ncbi:MAG: hypothetical protein ACD_62C00045G0007 [uncultured bacterium]|nr:MAG: hypothetical protein ACD_62C00045G0007 [uncultured bacterium]
MIKKAVSCVVFFVLVLLMVGSVSQSQAAWTSKKHKNEAEQIKNLNLARQKSVATRVVWQVIKDPFFIDAELARFVTLSKLEVKGPGIGISDIDYTNLVLNLLIRDTQIIVVNQEVKLDLSMDFKLMHYADGVELRKKGILLGANYYVDGDLVSSVIELPGGKVTQTYLATLIVRDIHTNEVLIQKQYQYQRKAGQKNAFRKDR